MMLFVYAPITPGFHMTLETPIHRLSDFLTVDRTLPSRWGGVVCALNTVALFQIATGTVTVTLQVNINQIAGLYKSIGLTIPSLHR